MPLTNLQRINACKKLWVMIFALTLFIGWSLATFTLKIFNKMDIGLQTLVMASLGTWKAAIFELVKFYSLSTEWHGEKYEVMLVATVCVMVHWFWTLFTTLAFAAVESWWTFVTYIAIDMGVALLFVYRTADHHQDFTWARVEGKLLPQRVKIDVPLEKASSFRLDKNYDILFNATCFFFIQQGEVCCLSIPICNIEVAVRVANKALLLSCFAFCSLLWPYTLCSSSYAADTVQIPTTHLSVSIASRSPSS